MIQVETSEFKVGDTTFDSHFFATVPEYGVPIPECRSSGPIINPVNFKLTDIVNMVERGLHVQLKNDIDNEKIYFFLVEYNKIAKEINIKNGEELNPIAAKAESYFLKKVNFRAALEKKREDALNENPFTKRIVMSNSDIVKAAYNNEFIANKFKKKSAKPKKPINDTRDATEHKMYEMFSQPNAVSSDGRLVVDPNTINGPSIPDFYEDFDFGV